MTSQFLEMFFTPCLRNLSFVLKKCKETNLELELGEMPLRGSHMAASNSTLINKSFLDEQLFAISHVEVF